MVSLDTHACKESKWNLVLIEETNDFDKKIHAKIWASESAPINPRIKWFPTGYFLKKHS